MLLAVFDLNEKVIRVEQKAENFLAQVTEKKEKVKEVNRKRAGLDCRLKEGLAAN